MMELVNQYCNGYLFTPVVEACQKYGLFELLVNKKRKKRQELITKLKANAGYLTIALRGLESLGWLERDTNDAYRLKSHVGIGNNSLDLTSLYTIDPQQLIREAAYARIFSEKIEKMLLRVHKIDGQSASFSEGAIIVLLIVALKQLNEKRICKEIAELEPRLAQSIQKLFISRRWMAVNKTQLTKSGKRLLQSSEFEITASLKSLLSSMEDLLFGDHESARSQIEKFNTWKNTLPSHTNQAAYANDLKEKVVAICCQRALEGQPQTVVHVGCGDGSLLTEIYQLTCSTVRGQYLRELPLKFIAVGYSQQELEETSKRLTKNGIKHQTFLGDVNRPDEIFQTLKRNGLTSEQETLYIQSFAGSQLRFDIKQKSSDALSFLANDQQVSYLDRQGKLLDSLRVMSCWQKYLQACAQGVDKSPLFLLENYACASTSGRQTIHSLAHQYFISAEAFITLAASVGLFNQSPAKYYKGVTNCSFHNLSKRDYVVRVANPKDLKILYRLEELCWPEQLRTTPLKIRERLKKYPEGQFVLEKDGKVLGAIYSQRIVDAEKLEKCNMDNVHNLHMGAGSIIQLLAVNIHPEAQNFNYGDQLLEFMLQRCSLIEGIKKIVAVSLCKNFNAKNKVPFNKYILQKGKKQDPILAFHQGHGARIVKALADYRPRDISNLGYGVLIEYNDLQNRVKSSRHIKIAENESADGSTATINRIQINQFVKEAVASFLDSDLNSIDLGRPLMEMGLNSVDLLSLQRQIEEQFHQCLQPGFFFEYSSCEKVIDYLTNRLKSRPEANISVHAAGRNVVKSVKRNILQKPADPDERNQTISDSDIAVVGISCRLPGGINSPDNLWHVLASEKCVISSYPEERGAWPSGVDQPGIDRGGFIYNADAFDASFFRITPKEAQILDPQQRILLELAWACFEDAGVVPFTRKATKTGVFVGASNSDYSRLVQDLEIAVEAHNAIGSSLAVLANRISYYFDFTGPSLLIDTACSSSLVALHTAIQSLRAGECSEALVGGVNFICHPDLSVAYYKAGMLSPDAQCKVFDAKANGYVRSEGAVVMLLKPLRQAVEDQNQIHAVIKGSSINHGGLAAGLTVPNPQKQSELLVAAWKNAGISAQDITYIEAHGTGTSLGDPIEMQGVQTAYLQVAPSKQDKSCGIGSIKSNLGHLESAAGLTGLLKVILSMKNQALPATINFSELNPKIHFKDTPFYIQNKLQRWERNEPYLAGVSSFGSGGTNAHVVVQEYKANVETPSFDEDQLFVLSAFTQECLHEYAVNVIKWLEEVATDNNFSDAIYSWQTGRTAMKHRLAIKVKDRKDLTNKLKQWVENKIAIDTWCGLVKSPMSNADQLWQGTPVRQLIKHSISKRDVGQLGFLWISGIDIDWHMLHKGHGEKKGSQRLISLPTYPFARERHWINADEAHQSAGVEGDVPKHTVGVSFAAPAWQLSKTELLANAEQAKFTRQYIFLCDMPQIKASQIEALFPNAHCVTILTRRADIADQYTEIALACFQEIQRILNSKQPGVALIQIVAAHTHEHTLFAGLSGLLKTVNLERPSLVGQVILTSSQITTARLSEQLLENQQHSQELIIKYEADGRHILRWQTVKSAIDKPEIVFKNHGSYLITGGLGGLGILFAKEILQNTTDARIILTGRSKLTDAKQVVFEQLSAGSNRISYVQTDINNLDQVKELIGTVRSEHKNLNGVIHCAGAVSGNYLLNKTLDEFNRILKPKVTGTFNLDIATQDIDLDFFVLFSSIASVIGLQGLADYATANGFMDHFASYRNYLAGKNERQGRTLSINWPLWQDGGMAMEQSTQDRLRHSLGMLPMRTITGINAFHRHLSLQSSQVLVMEGILSKVETSFAELNRISCTVEATQPVAAIQSKLLYEKTLQKVKQLFGKVVSLSVSKIDENEALLSYGIDSIFITHLNRELSKIFGEISKTLFFEYKTLAELTTYLANEYANGCLSWTGLSPQQILLQNTDKIEPASNSIDPFSVHSKTGIGMNVGKSTQRQQIAIIGISGMYPQAANLDECWENFRTGRNCITEIPSDRWDLEKFYDPDKKRAVEKGKSYCKWGGFIDQFSQFDPLFFGISPREAMNIDPQERLFLQASWQALESSGYTRSDLKDKYEKKVGVFAGITKTGYDLYGSQFSNGGEKFHPRTSFGSIANRVSYFLDITAASIPIDTMCSSSLTAIHEACEHINRGECNLAFAGGVNLYLHPSTYVWLSAQLMLSNDGICRSFGAGANGFVPGEGVGVVLLKPLAAAIQDNDTIHGVILASHVNHGGKTNGYFVPNPNAHAELIRHTIDKAGISARDISYIEAHGTGTELGDPIEISGLQQAFAKDTEDTSYCKIGSTKSNIGHLEGAAGIAGLTKILLQMKHGQIAPSLHSEVLNPNIDFAKTPFIVNQNLTTWDAPLINGQQKPRIAGISSFGAGGVNAHVIVQEYVTPKEVVEHIESNTDVVIPLSARTEKQLRQRAQDLLDFIQSAQLKEVDLHAIAYTLQVGREAMDERLGFIVNSVDSLVLKLHNYIARESDIEDAFQGQPKSNKDTVSLFNTDSDFQQMIDKWIVKRRFSKLLDLWVKGIDLDWNKFYGQTKPQRISLPTYPFADERYWIDSLETVQSESLAADSILHPLLHANTSNLYQQSYATTFSGDEFFIRDHKINGRKVLPAFAYLEMASAAVVRAMPVSEDPCIVELHDFKWAQPIVVDNRQIRIALSADENEQVSYAISCDGMESEIIHCQGRAVFSNITACDKIDIEKLKRQTWDKLEASVLYRALAKMGTEYGNSLQNLEEIYRDKNQLLAEIRLTSILDSRDYCLHPGIMDSALQACVALIADLNSPPSQPLLPTNLKSIAVLSSCTSEMYAWIRYSDAIHSEDEVIRLDIDLCDQIGNVCVKIRALELAYLTQSPVFSSLNISTDESVEKPWDKKSYIYRWEEFPSAPVKVSPDNKNVLIVCSGSSYQFEDTIWDYYNQNKNCQKTLIRLSDKTKLDSENEWFCATEDVNGFKTCLRNIEGIDALYFLSMTQKQSDPVSLKELVESQESNEVQLLRLIKCLKEGHKIKEQVDTYILTLDKFPLNDHSEQPLGAGVTGFAYSLAQGNYQFRVRNIDLFSGDLERKHEHRNLFSSIIKESSADRGEVFKIQSGKRFRQTFYKLNWSRTNSSNLRHNGVYLIVGGSGTVGQIFTRNLIQKYNATVIWIGRSAKDSETVQKTLKSFGNADQNLIYVQADVTDLHSMQHALESIKKKYDKINGAIFSGMVFDFENSIVQTSEADFRSIVDIKTKGSWVFYKVLENEPLDFMCYFSSGQAYSFSGAAKLVGYASAITSSDTLVRSLQKVARFPVGIINWGYWKDTVKKINETTGGIRTDNLDALGDREGFECFEQFIDQLHFGRLNQVLCLNTSPQVGSLMNCSQEEIASITDNGTIRLTRIVKNDKESNESPSLPAAKSNNQVKKPITSTIASKNITEYIWDNILKVLSNVLRIPSDSIDPNIAFSEYGVDSILGVKFIDHVNTCLSISLNTAIIFEYASINRLSEHIVKVYRDQVEPQVNAQLEPFFDEDSRIVKHKEVVPKKIGVVPQRLFTGGKKSINKIASPGKRNNLSDIAVVGMSGKFPKAENVKEFWENLVKGVDGIEELPAHYLDQVNYFTTKKQRGMTRCKWGGVLSERDCFDPLFFNISPKEAASMNPHQRLVLQESWKALEDAGYNPRDLSGHHTGVFVGAEPTAYLGDGFTGYSDAIIASRLSYIVNLRGPSIVVNTGCSSSAVALHLACESLRNKESDIALAGGVHACMGQYVQIILDQIEMLSPSGRCFTFDDAGDGTILSEGIGMVVLKRLEDAVASGDFIHGVICGSGINQDGASNGITAPNGAAQEELFTSVYDKFQINPENISYVEAHGTATKLGDPVEANALVRTFKKFSDKKEYCAIGSVKSFIGHTSAAAGVVGLMRILLSMRHKQIPKLMHFKNLNPLIEFKNSPFYINTQLTEWKSPENTPRMAALNSFGHSGTNAHLVVKEYIPIERDEQINPISATHRDVIIPLSAKTPEQLRQKVYDLLTFIRATNEQSSSSPSRIVDLEAVAFTLQTGREAMEERLGFVVSSVGQLAEKLQAYLDGFENRGNFYQGYVKHNINIHSLKEGESSESIDELIAVKNVSAILRLWIKGFEFDWKKLYGEKRPKRVSLPTYPFAKEKYWIDTAILPNQVLSEIKSTCIHPLLHNNTSDLSQQKYSSTFNGKEFFLRDHQVNGKKMLPGVAYLEMARTAAQNATPFTHESSIIELHNAVWAQPIVVEKDKEVSIALFANDEGDGVFKQIDYEIYSLETSKKVVHSRGQAVFSINPTPAKLDFAALKRQMNLCKFEKADIYRVFGEMGINFGPSHQSLVSIDLGEKQLLAQLSLPAVIGNTLNDYVFHPSIMDGALQSCNGLISDFDETSRQSVLPYAVKTIRIFSRCTNEMIAWVRFSQGCKPGDKIIKIDLDICDLEGNICVQMLEFSTRVLEKGSGISNENADSLENGTAYSDTFYAKVIGQIINKEISVDEAVELE